MSLVTRGNANNNNPAGVGAGGAGGMYDEAEQEDISPLDVAPEDQLR